MPNNVINEIILHGVTRNQAQPLIGKRDLPVDFSVLLPLSPHFWPGDVSLDHRTFFPGTQLEEATEKWGTKWNAYGKPTVEARGEDYVLTFQTAWNTPRGWTCALFNALKCSITCRWLDEGAQDAWLETYNYEGQFGPTWEKSRITNCTPDHLRLHKLLWGVERFEEDTPSQEQDNDE